jgi:hypothetical protein
MVFSISDSGTVPGDTIITELRVEPSPSYHLCNDEWMNKGNIIYPHSSNSIFLSKRNVENPFLPFLSNLDLAIKANPLILPCLFYHSNPKPAYHLDMKLISIATACVLVLTGIEAAATKNTQLPGLEKIKHVVYFMQVR